MDKTIYQIWHTKKRIQAEKNEKDGKALYKLMNNAIYRKAIQVNNEIDYLKSTSKPSYLSH